MLVPDLCRLAKLGPLAVLRLHVRTVKLSRPNSGKYQVRGRDGEETLYK